MTTQSELFPPADLQEITADQRANHEKRRLMPRAAEARDPEGSFACLSLVAPKEKSTVFPVSALGAIPKQAVEEIAGRVQCHVALAATGALCAMATATQAIADIHVPARGPRPLGLYFMTFAGYDDRKQKADEWALRALDRGQQEAASHIGAFIDQNSGALEDVLKRSRNIGFCGDDVVAVMPTKAGQTTPRIQSLARLWDGRALQPNLSHPRGADNNAERLCLHLRANNDDISAYVNNNPLRDIGLASQFLISAPESLCGQRLLAEDRHFSSEGIDLFEAGLQDLTACAESLAEKKQGEIRRTMSLSPTANRLWIAYHNEIETACGPGRELHDVRDFVGAIPEQAARIAAVLAVFEDPACVEVSEEQLARGIEISRYFLAEAVRLVTGSARHSKLPTAQKMLKVAQERAENGAITLKTLMQYGPHSARDRDSIIRMMRLLEDYGWVREIVKANSRATHSEGVTWCVALHPPAR